MPLDGADDQTESREERKPKTRSADLLGREDSPCRRAISKMADDIRRGFEDQSERADCIMDYWDAYNCILNANQFYDGDAQIYIPAVRDAVNARATRFINQLFPPGGHYVEGVSKDGTVPQSMIALLDHYIRRLKLKTQIAKALSRNGDIEGQYNLYVDWMEVERQVVSRETRDATVPMLGEQMPVPGEQIEDIVIEDVTEGMPSVEVLHDADVLVLPSSADSIEDALAFGGTVAIVRRWSKAKVEKMMERGRINKQAGKDLLERMKEGALKDPSNQPADTGKKINEMIGIRKKGSETQIWEAWKMLPLSDDGSYSEKGEWRLCLVLIGPDAMPLGCVRNPYWNDFCPLLSSPVEKIAGVLKGKSQVEPIISIQYEINDAVNEGADAAHYAAMPIAARNPTANQQPLVANIGAVWDVAPGDIQFMEWPDLTPRAMTRIQYGISQIFQSLGVNPSMLPQQTSQSKRNQAQVAQEQQVDLLTTAESTVVIAENMLTPLMQWWVDLDYQYRDEPILLRKFGKMGRLAIMEEVPPLESREHYDFRWSALEMAANAQRMQTQISWINVAQGAAPLLQQEGYMLKLSTVFEQSALAVFGAETAQHVLVDQRAQMSVPPDIENEWLSSNYEVPVSPFDNPIEHIKAHQQALQETGDLTGQIRIHLMKHMMAMQAKMAAMQQQQMQQQIQPPPGRGGGAGQPRPGAQVGQNRPMTRPPGMIHQDQLPRAGVVPMPRRM